MQKTFDDLQQALAHGGADDMLVRLANFLRQEQRYDELFEALLMQGRRQLGLPIARAPSLDELPETLRTQMEDVYLSACREVGMLWLAAGELRRGWTYLHPVGDRAAVAEALRQHAPTEENIDQYVEITVHGAVDPEAGFQAVLGHYGTCNAITMFEGMAAALARREQQTVAALLVRHLHEELVRNLRADIERREGPVSADATISTLVANRDWLFADHNYHVDSSHLAATVRFARLCEDADTLRLAVELTEYGRRLSSQYQFPGEEPFAEVYPSSALFFGAQLGEGVDEALHYFRDKAESLPAAEQGTGAAETWITLLARLGRYEEALDAAARLLPPGTRTTGFAPSLLDLSTRAGRYDRFLDLCQERGDVVGFAAALAAKHGVAD